MWKKRTSEGKFEISTRLRRRRQVGENVSWYKLQRKTAVTIGPRGEDRSKMMVMRSDAQGDKTKVGKLGMDKQV